MHAVVQSKIRTVMITGINELIEEIQTKINDSMIHTIDRNYACGSPFYAGHLKSHVLEIDTTIYISTESSTSTRTETKFYIGKTIHHLLGAQNKW